MARKKREPKIECIAYLSVEGDPERVDRLEDKQLKYIREYAKAHNIDVVGIKRRHGFGYRDVYKHFCQMAAFIAKGKVDGVILVNMKSVSQNVEDAYAKIGKINGVGGVIVTVDEGRLSLGIMEV